MLHLFKSAASRAITFGLIGMLTVGLLVGAIRLALPFAGNFRSELEGVLSETLGLPVRMGRFGLRLVGLVPRLTLLNAELLDPKTGHPQLSLKELQVDLDLLASLHGMAPQIESVTLVGAQLVVKRLQDGSIVLSGLEGLEAGDPEALTFFFGNGRFLLAKSDLYWIDEKAGAPELHLSDLRVDFENRGDRHRVAVLAQPFADPQTRLHLVADMLGEPGRPTQWKGEVFFHWQGADLAPVFAGRLPADLHLGSDSVELESWSQLEGSSVIQSLNRIRTRGLRVWSDTEGASAAPLRLDQLEGLLRWHRLGDGWRLEAKDLVLTRGGIWRPPTDLGIRFTAGSDGSWTIQGGNTFLELADSRDLLAQLSRLEPEVLDPIGEMRLGGVLRDLRFRFVHIPESSPRWAVSGQVEDLSLDAYGHFPGIRGLSALAAGNEREGELALSASDLALDLPHLLPDPIELDQAVGDVYWQRDAGGALRIGAQEIVAGNADIATSSRFSIALPAGGGSPFLDLRTEFHDGRAAAVRRYVPSKRLKEKLASWLDRAFVAGSIPSGTLRFHGAVADFPFDQHKGRFQVLLDIKDCTLDFNPDWPPLEGVTAKVRFENREMEILASQGQFLDNALSDVSVRIPDLGRAVALEVKGTAEGSFANGLRVLGETPLRKNLGALAEIFEAEGMVHLDLDMAVPLRHKGHKGPLRLAGKLTWPKPAALTIRDLDIHLTGLTGELRFTENTLVSKSIDAKLWDVPLHIGVETIEPQGSAATSTRIRAHGRFPVPVLAQQFPSPAWEPLKGQTPLELRLDIGSEDLGETVPPIDFELTSDLAGLDLGLPAPLGKPAAVTRPLRLSGRLAPQEALEIKGAYGDLGINLGLERGGDTKLRLARATFDLGGTAPRLPKGEGLHLSGSIDTLDLQPWLDWLADSKLANKEDSGGSAGLRALDVHMGRLLVSGTALDEVQVNATRGRDRWEAKISAQELEGQISIPHRPRGEPIRVALVRLDLKDLLDAEGEEGKEAQQPTQERYADPRQADTLDLSIERLLWGENPLGRVTIRSEAVPEGLRFTDLALTGPYMTIRKQSGSWIRTGSWIQTETGPRSSFSLNADGADLGEFLRSLEFESVLDKAPADLKLSLGWPGGPLQYAAADLKGKIHFDVGAGRLLEVEPGVGRVLGVLNLGPLQRRLTLDFSDLFGRGLAFDKISGKIDIGNGEADIEKLVIEGPSADISITGSANLVDKELNQIATVTPRIGTGVAIASAVAGGPLVGAAVFLADKVSGGAVDKLGRHQYVLTGPWADPEIRRGKRGAKAKLEAAREYLLKDSGRAGASGLHEPKSRETGTASPKETEAAKPVGGSPAFKDENLFLEMY